MGRFYTVLLSATGAPVRTGHPRVADLEQVALRVLRTAGVQVLVIDELHNLLSGGGDRRREFLNLIRFLGNELRIPLVGAGTREAYLAIRADDPLWADSGCRLLTNRQDVDRLIALVQRP